MVCHQVPLSNCHTGRPWESAEKMCEASVSSFSKTHPSHASLFANSQARTKLDLAYIHKSKEPFCRDLSQIVQQTCHCTEIYFNGMSNNTVIIQQLSKIIIHFYGFAPKGYL